MPRDSVGELAWTPRAQQAFANAMADARGRVMTVVRTASARRESGHDWHHGKKALQGVRENVYELRYTHSCRVLIQEVERTLVVVDIGDHDVTSRYADLAAAKRASLLAEREPVPEWFIAPHPLFEEVDDSALVADGDASGWAAFLSDQQAAIADLLEQEVVESIDQAGPLIAYLRGGAGTGKTAVLLNVALRLHDLGLAPEFRCSPALAKYLRAHTHVNVRLLGGDPASPSVILIDDPSTPAVVQDAVREAAESGAVAVIVGFDPMQWPLKSLSAQLDALPDPHIDEVLHDCYRQSSGLAKKAIKMISLVHERSSFRVDPARIEAEREALAELSAEYLDGLEFSRPGGRFKVHAATMPNLVAEATRFRSRTDLWTDLPALLVLEDRANGVTLTNEGKNARRGIKTQTEDLDQVGRYRGLDFQGVWIFMRRDYYERVQRGATGLKGAEWTRLLQLHIPLTRARDEAVLFLVD